MRNIFKDYIYKILASINKLEEEPSTARDMYNTANTSLHQLLGKKAGGSTPNQYGFKPCTTYGEILREGTPDNIRRIFHTTLGTTDDTEHPLEWNNINAICRNLLFNDGNIIKACMRYGVKNDNSYELTKIQWFCLDSSIALKDSKTSDKIMYQDTLKYCKIYSYATDELINYLDGKL